MTLQQLRYFLAAVERGSFSAAAESLHLAQPSLSEQVRQLEAELGAALFVRAGRRLVLTEAGETLRPEAEAVLAAAERARTAVAEVRELESGTAALGTFGSPWRFFAFGSVVAEFRRRHPDVRLRIVGQNSSEVADAVREGELEAGIIVLPVDDRGLEVRPLLENELLVASADPERVARPVTIEQLAAAPLILYDARWGAQDPTRRLVLDRAQRAGLALEPEIEVEEPGAALDLAARGLGDTVVQRSVVEGPRFPRRLHTAPFAEPLHETFAVVRRRGGQLSRATQELLELTERRIEQQSKGD